MRLLIIDDDKVCTFITSWVAKKSGIFSDIQSVGSGRAALTILNQVSKGMHEMPDLILLDLNMPLMSGFDFIECLNELTFADKKRPTIVILTSSDNATDMERARALGIENYLLKSLKLNDLQSSLYALYNKANTASKWSKATPAANQSVY